MVDYIKPFNSFHVTSVKTRKRSPPYKVPVAKCRYESNSMMKRNEIYIIMTSLQSTVLHQQLKARPPI